MRKIKLTQGKYALIDNEDFELVSKHKWHYRQDQKGKTGYAIHSFSRWPEINPWCIRMHRLIIGATKKQQVDHINQNKLDNRRSNLRISTQSENGINRKKFKRDSSSKYKGVSWYKHSNPGWVASTRLKGKMIYIGKYKTQKDAARAYNKKVTELFGNFACINKL